MSMISKSKRMKRKMKNNMTNLIRKDIRRALMCIQVKGRIQKETSTGLRIPRRRKKNRKSARKRCAHHCSNRDWLRWRLM